MNQDTDQIITNFNIFIIFCLFVVMVSSDPYEIIHTLNLNLNLNY